ncbi:MAG: hypothetical protein HFE77_04160 [Clostridiales bacterium]|nr:hypothetical protein [Clostridiales bacterium]
MMNKYLCLFMGLLVSLSFCACSQDDNVVEASIFSFDKSSALLLNIEDQIILINTGGPEEAKKILQYLHEQEINRIDLLILSSFTSDCMGGAEKIIKNIDIGRVYEPVYSMGNEYVKEYYFALSAKDIMPIVVREDLTISIGHESLCLFVSGQESEKETSNQVLAVKADCSGQQFLYWPSMDDSSILVDGHCDLFCDYLYVPNYHDWQAFANLLAMTKPRMAFISKQTVQMKKEAEKVSQEAGCTIYFINQEFLSVRYENGQAEIGS